LALRISKKGKITLLYSLSVGIFVVFFRGGIEGYRYHLLFNGSVIGLLLFLESKEGDSTILQILSAWYPIILYTFLYYQTGLINREIIPRFLDGSFIAVDRIIAGTFPLPFPRGLYGNPFVVELSHLSYLSYYLLVPVTGILLYRNNVNIFEEYVFQMSALFYLCYGIYIILPVEGPLHLRVDYFGPGGPLQRLVEFIYRNGENPGAAFPSSHVAVGIFVAWWGSRFSRTGGKILYWGTVSALTFSTIFCLFHYLIDVVAGIILAFLFIWIFHPGSQGKSYEKTICCSNHQPGSG
jgi:membrane-associated phospholipid phosphatase